MWTKLEGAISAECNEIVASNKLKEQVQKPKRTVTSFVTDLMLLVKDCNYIDEDRQVRGQFVYGISDDDLKTKLLEKGHTLTRIQAVSIGKAHETTNQGVQECCLHVKPPVSESTNAVYKDKPNKGLCVTNHFKIPRNVSDSKKKENQNQEIKGNQDQLRNHLSWKLMKMAMSIFMKLWTKCALWINNVTIGKHLQTCSSQKKEYHDLWNFRYILVLPRVLPVGVYKEISGYYDLQDLNTTACPTLSIHDEETKLQTLGIGKGFVFNPATEKEGIIHFRTVNEDLTHLIGLNDSDKIRLLELLQKNIATLDPMFLHLFQNYTHHLPWQPFRVNTLMCLITM